MFSGIKRFIGYVGVEETETHIIIEGLPGYDIQRDIHTKWQTSKVNNQMFTVMNKSKIVFTKFFAIDVLYIFEALLADKKSRTSKRLLEKIIEELYHKTWLQDLLIDNHRSRLNFSKLKEINLTMLPHQREFLENYDKVTTQYRLNGLLLAAAPGSGKTLTCLAVGVCREADVIIAIVPKVSLERVWEKTMKENLVGQPAHWVSKNLGESAPPGLRYYAFHYEALDRAIELAKTFKRGTQVTVILDECHNLNEINSVRTQLFIKLCDVTQSDDVIWSSGTPIKAIGAESVPLLKTIDPMFNKESEERFRKIYGKDAKKANDILRNRIGIVSFKINKKEVVKGEVHYNPIKVKIPNGDHYTLDAIRADMQAFIQERSRFYAERMSEYHTLYQDCLATHAAGLRNDRSKEDFATYKRYVRQIREKYDPVLMKTEVMYCNKYELQQIIPSLPVPMNKEFKSIRSVIKYVDLKIMGEALGGVLGKRRSQCHVDMLPYMQLDTLIDGAEKKTIIFTSYVEVVEKAADWVTANGYQPVKVYGGTNKNLSQLIGSFDKKVDVNPLIATYQSLSTAMPLVMANNLIMTNAPFRDHEREQAISRCDRIGQDRPVSVNDIFLDTGDKPNISTRSKDILDWSKHQVESIMGVSAPTDLSAALESFVDSTVPLTLSQERFMASMESFIHGTDHGDQG